MIEQKLIVEEIDQRLTNINEMEKFVDTALKVSNLLRQSILKRAFEGKLVSQDPNDEPASMLLDRIRANKPLGSDHKAVEKLNLF
jgi:type I restriction enzyme S subunit